MKLGGDFGEGSRSTAIFQSILPAFGFDTFEYNHDK